MQSVIISVAVVLLAFAMGLVGLHLKRHLPERHMSMGSRDMFGAIMGLLSLLLALVLEILVGDAHQFFASQKAELESLGTRSLELELAFRQYGLETEPLRQLMKASVQEHYGDMIRIPISIHLPGVRRRRRFALVARRRDKARFAFS